MSRKLDFSKLKFSDKEITTEETLKDVEPWIDFEKEDNLSTLKQIQEKNRTETTLLGSEINNQEYSKELIEQCRHEFETFVKPIGYKTLQRYLENEK